jgi:hypothetical protein
MTRTRAGKINLPNHTTNLHNSTITNEDVEKMALERQKIYLYRLAMVENTQSLLSLLLLTRDKKMENFVNSVLAGAFACTSTLLLVGTLFGLSLSASVIILTFIGGGLINAFVED